MPETISIWLVATGALLLVGMLASLAAERSFLPRVTLLLLAGLAVGPSGFDLLPGDTDVWYPVVSTITLIFVGFLLGGRLRLSVLKAHGKEILSVTAFKVAVSALLVFVGLRLLGFDPVLSIILAGISTATAPAAVQSVVQDVHADGPFSDVLLGVVALDDAAGLMLFAVLLSFAHLLLGHGAVLDALAHVGWEVGGAVGLGVLIGYPSALLTRRLRGGDPLEAEALGAILLCGGLAILLGVSYLIAAIVLGATIANLAADESDDEDEGEPFHMIAKAEWPLLVVFFILSGAVFDFSQLGALGPLGLAYIFLRIIGLITGTWIGAAVAGVQDGGKLWLGVALLPQAGVALGMALVAGQAFPEYAGLILSVTVGTTIFFEILGPVLTRLALVRAGET